MRGRVGWLVLDCQLKLAFGFHTVALPAKLNERERGVRLSQGFVHVERFNRSFLGLRKTVFWLIHTVDHLHVVAVS